MKLKHFFGHLRVITRHRHMVLRGCFRAGLYRQGLLHDLSKYSPTEFLRGVKYYQQGKRSPVGAERRATGMSVAWLHHKSHNRHHLEYWLDWTAQEPIKLTGMPIPKKYVAEMAIDRLCASRNYKGNDYTDASPLEYLMHRKVDLEYLHPEAGNTLIRLFTVLAEQGEDAFYRALKEYLKQP